MALQQCQLLLLLPLFALFRSCSTATASLPAEPKKVVLKIGLADDESKICHGLTNKTFNAMIYVSNVTVEFELLNTTMTYKTVPEFVRLTEEFRNKSLSAIFSAFNPVLAEITDELNIPYFTAPLATKDLPLRSKSMLWMHSYDFGLPHAIRDLIKAIKPLRRLIIISNSIFEETAFYVRVLEPLKIFVTYLDFANGTSQEDFRAQITNLSLPFTDDIGFLILLYPEYLQSVETILWAGLYAGYMNKKQLWLIGSFDLKFTTIKHFVRTRSRIITFSLPNGYTMSTLGDKLCEQLTHHIMKTEVKPGTDRLKKIRTNVTSKETGRLFFNEDGRIDLGFQINVVEWGNEAQLLNIAKWDGLTKTVNLVHRTFTLKPLPVKVGTIIDRPYFSLSSTGERIGFFVDLLQELSERLNWDVTYIYDYKDLGHRLDNGSWTGLLGELEKENVDVIASSLSPVAERKEIMMFSPPVLTEGYSWLAMKEPPDVFWLIYFQPFVSWIWVALVIIFFLSWLTFFLIELMSPKRTTTSNAKKKTQQNIPFANGYNFGDVFVVIVSTMTIGKVPVSPRMLSARMFIVILWFFSLVTVLSYSAYLTAYLYQPSSKMSPKGNFEQILNKSGTYRWFWTHGEATFTRMLNEANGTIPNRLAVTAQQNWPSEMFVPRDQILDVLLTSHNKIFIGENAFVAYHGTTNCSFEHGPEILMASDKIVGFKKSFRDYAAIDTTITAIKTSVIDPMHTKWVTYTNNCVNTETLGINVVASLFAVLAGGIVLGLLIGFIEWLIKELKLCRIRCKLPKLQFGNVYEAEVESANDDGVWMSVENRPNKYYLPASQLHPEPIKTRRPKDLGIRSGSKFEVRYFGKDPVSGAKRFVRETAM